MTFPRRVDGLCHLWLWSGPVITRHVRSRHSVTHVTCHEVGILIMIMITITTSHLLAAAAGGWLRPTVAIFSLLFSPAVLCLYCKQLYFYIFFLCFGVIFYYFDHGEIIYGGTRWIEDDCSDTFSEFIFPFPPCSCSV